METIDVVDASTLEYSSFFQKYLVSNMPVLISGVSRSWRSHNEWVQNGKPNFEVLGKLFGDAVVNCSSLDYGEQLRRSMSFGNFLELWVRGDTLSGSAPLYLKDWHFYRQFKDRYQAYSTPSFFADDWLNEYWDSRGDDDYRFVYMGPAGSWTGLHHDVLRTLSWSTNLCGRKLWYFFPPEEENKLLDRFQRAPPADIRPYLRSTASMAGGRDSAGTIADEIMAATTEVADWDKFPNLRPGIASVRYFSVIQGPGDAIFVPSGWYHQVSGEYYYLMIFDSNQVHNLDETISINHNWFNGPSLSHVWGFVKKSLHDIEREIGDLRSTYASVGEWDLQCQVLLKANIGLDFLEWGLLLKQKALLLMEALLQHSTTKPMTSRVLSAVLPSSTLRTDFLADEGAECGFSLEKISKNHALVTQLFEAAAEAVAADVKLPLDESWAVFSLIKLLLVLLEFIEYPVAQNSELIQAIDIKTLTYSILEALLTGQMAPASAGQAN